MNPLRVYYYEKNSHLRVCPEPYDASDPENVDSYVIHTDHIPGYDFPPIKKYFEKSYTFKEALNLYFIHNGHDPVIIWDQIEGCIHSTLMAIEPQMINRVKFKFFRRFNINLYFCAILDKLIECKSREASFL